jgi:4-amino-4-deoxy-L-arabinose transferase-like glycosyltransferase
VRLLAAALAVVTLIRLAVAATIPLAPDETYYWIWSHALAGGYLDHPPMVALWIRAGTALIGQTALGVRLFGPLAATLASCMLFDAARALFPRTKAGVAAVLLLNASLLLGVGTVIMTPDSPLLFFWTTTFWAMARLAAGGSGLWWLVAGVAGGLALDSKYTALFLWAGVGLWLLMVPAVRPWLGRWQSWTACVIGLALFVPVLAWNSAHDWAGFARQGGRINDWHLARAIGFLAELLGGQIGLVTPLVWALCLAGLGASIEHAWRRRDPGSSLLVALSVPPIIVFLQHAFGDRVQGNWPAIIYPALAVAAGGMALRSRWWIGASALGFAITAVVYLQALAHPIALPARLDPIALRLAGWDGLAAEVEAARVAADADFIVADSYAVTSELVWWLPPGVSVIGIEARWWLLDLPRTPIGGATGLWVTDAGHNLASDTAPWTHVERVGTANRPGSGTPGLALYKILPRAGVDAVVLARRQ